MTSVGDLLQHGAPYFVSYAGAMLVQSSLLILILLAVEGLLRHRVRPAVRYAMWMLVLAKLLLPPTLASPTSPVYWLSPQLASIAVIADPVPRGAVGSVTPVADRIPRRPASDARVTAASGTGAGRATDRLSRPVRSVPVPVVLFTVWLAGVFVLGAWIISAGRAARRLVAFADAPPDDLRALVDDCRRDLGVKRPIDVRCTSLAPVPAILGVWRPVILVPTPLLASLTTAQMRAVLLHEVAHAKRGDVWVDCVQAIVQVVHWFNPLVWVANAVIRQVREQAVDEVVLAHMGETPEVYPETLLHVARIAVRSTARVRAPGLALFHRATGLRRRITRMLERPAPSTVRVGIGNVLLIAAVAMTALPMAPRAEVIEQDDICDASAGARAYIHDLNLYENRKAQWLACVEARPVDLNVIEMAGDFVALIDPYLARALYERARGLAPHDPRWTSKLVHHRLNTPTNATAELERRFAAGKGCDLPPFAFAPIDTSLYETIKKRWLACLEEDPDNLKSISGAAGLMEVREPDLAIIEIRELDLARNLLEPASALEPLEASRWVWRLVLLRAQQRRVLDATLALTLKPAEQAIRALQDAERQIATAKGMSGGGREPQYIVLPRLAFNAEDMIKARTYAEELLAMTQRDEWSPDWTGTAVHEGNLVLGRVAVREGKLSEAITFLHRSGNVAYLSNMREPDMSLAKDLLEAGEAAAVLAYFEQSRPLWVQMQGELAGELLDLWAAEVRQGYIPKFDTSLSY